MRQPLRIFKQPKLVWNADQHVGIRTYAETTAMLDKMRRGKCAIAKVGFGDGTKPRDRAACGHAAGFVHSHVGRVDQAPAAVYVGI